MTRLLDSLGLWFTDYYLLSAVLLLLALVAIRLTRQPIHRLTIVKSTLVALALLAGLCALPGWSIVHLMTTQREVSHTVPQAAMPTTDPAALKQFIVQNDGNVSAEQPRVMPSAVVPVQTPSATSNMSWRELLATAQIGGASIAVAWLACGWIAARRLRLSAQSAPPHIITLLRESLPTNDPLASGIELLTSSRITVPVALGLYHPLILLPQSLAETQSAIRNPQSEIAPILAHELAHIRNHDLHWLAVSRALMILLWSQPLYWFARRRMRLDQESLADAAAAEVSTREQYAEQLVNWARNLGGRRTMRIASAVGLWEGPSQLRQRIALLLDDRFIILRHFSRKLQLAAIALCALTAAALSLVTLEPAQSKPQEKPAAVAGAPSSKDKLSEPDHITIDDRFILSPVTTELQRSLLGDVDTPKSNASLCIFANYGAYQGDAIEPGSAFFTGLSDQLAALAKRDNRFAIVSVQVGQISQPFDKLRGRAEQLSKIIEKLARDAGFKQSRWGVTYQGTTLGWSEIAANAEAAAKLAESGVEDSIGDEQIRVFPVRTFLSRMLMQDADCVVNVRPVWQMADGPDFVDSFVPSLKRFIPELKYVRKEMMYVRVRFARDAQPFVDQWSGNSERSKKFGHELGFADSRNQQAGVSDEDAKQDKEARAASPARPAGAAVDKADPSLPRPEFKPNVIAGRAVDEKGAPVAGAEVFLFWIKLTSGERQQIAQTKTDDQGNYRFANVLDVDKEFPDKKFPPSYDVGDRMLQGVIRAPGRVSSWWVEVPQFVAQHGRWYQWPMAPAATLEGHITGPDGKPVADAIVAVSNGSVGTWEGASSAKTDAAGYYKITDAPPFDLEKHKNQVAEQEKRARALAADGQQSYDLFVMKPTVTVSHADFAQLHSDIERSPGTKDLQLESPAILEGRVVFPDGKPAAGAVVSAVTSYQIGAPIPRAASVPVFYKATAVADDSGRYRITSLPSGKYDIWANAPDWINVGEIAFAAASDKSNAVPDLAMTKGAIVRARVIDEETRQPIALTPDARAMLLVEPAPPRSAGRAEPAHYVAADAESRFERRATPGKKIVVIGGLEMDGEQKWYGKEHVEVQLTEGETLDVDVPVTKIVPEPTGRFVEIGATQVTTHQDPKEALKTLDEQLNKNPEDDEALLHRALTYSRMDDGKNAIADYERLIEKGGPATRTALAMNNLAFILATSADENLRDSKKAVALAEKATELGLPLTADALDTLAAAYAESGDFDKAVKTQKDAVEAAQEENRARFREHLKLYESHKPLRRARAQSESAPKENEGANSPSESPKRRQLSFKKVGESLVSTTDAESADTSAQLLVEPRDTSHPEGSPTAAEPSTESSNQDRESYFVRIPVRVVSEAGEPVAGATIEPLSFQLQTGAPRIELVQTTDKSGQAQIPFPRGPLAELGISQCTVRVVHRDYISHTTNISTTNQGSSWWQPRIAKTPATGQGDVIALKRGGAVEIKAEVDSAVGDVGPIYGIVSQLDPTLRWPSAGDRIARSPQLPPGDMFIGAVAFPKNAAQLFSDVTAVRVVAGQTQQLHVALKPGWPVSGRLADNVPRPVQNGRVMLQIISKASPGMGWSDWTTVRDDGTFTFESLPRDIGAEVRFTAVCNGFVSKTPDDLAKQYQLLAPQTFTMKENGIDCTLEMTPAAKCVVKVQDTKGKPLAGVQVVVQPAGVVDHGTGSFGELIGMKDVLISSANRPIVDRAAFPYVATSDENGNAELSNLPPFPTYISAANEHYSLPKNPIFALAGAPPIPVIGIYLHSGETTTPTLTLIATQPTDTKSRK